MLPFDSVPGALVFTIRNQDKYDREVLIVQQFIRRDDDSFQVSLLRFFFVETTVLVVKSERSSTGSILYVVSYVAVS